MLEPIQIDPKTFLRQHCHLPALPEVVGKIQKMIPDRNVDITKVADAISSDPGILAQVLKVVNSAYFGLPTEVKEARMAAAFLGLNEISRIVLSLAAVNNLAIKQKKEVDAFWFHSFFTATCTKHLAQDYEPLLSFEELWSAAIIHDIGKLVYLKFFPEHYQALSKFSIENGRLFSEAESHFSFPSSAYLGTLLCDRWRLPDHVRRACEFHTLEDLQSIGEISATKPFERIICLGNLVAVLSKSDLSNEAKKQIADAVQADLGLNEDDFLALMGDVYEWRTEVDAFMSLFS
jgi:HD-like signal output (HDOD) protein